MPQRNGYFPTSWKAPVVVVLPPFGYEASKDRPPLLSRSYAFNWSPPFTHWGVLGILNLDKNFQATGGIVNGNDVMIFDPAEAWRLLAKLGYTSDDKKLTWAFGTSIGQGKFNTSEPFAPATIALANEPAGRNNINVFDFTITEEVSDEVTLGFEAIYGYQTGVPCNVAGGMIDTTKTPGQSGTAHWGSLVGYGFYKFCERDRRGSRQCSGLRASELASSAPITLVRSACEIKPYDCMLVRPKSRYDTTAPVSRSMAEPCMVWPLRRSI